MDESKWGYGGGVNGAGIYCCRDLRDGKVLWKSEIDDPEVFDPYEITVEDDNILVKYGCGLEDGYRLVTLNNLGQLISIR